MIILTRIKETYLNLLTEELVSGKGDNIDWDYKSNTLDIKNVEKLNQKIKSILKNNPKVL